MTIIFSEGTPEDRCSIKLSTKKGNWIENQRKLQVLPERMRAAEKLWKASCRGIITRSLSSTYNCVGMVFGTRRTCIDPDQLSLIFRDDEYIKILRHEAMIGDIVAYKNDPKGEIRHVAVIVNILDSAMVSLPPITVLSQWGFDGEYVHLEQNVPAIYGNIREYHTERT